MVAPVISGLTPSSGSALGFIPVVIAGASFTGATVVTFDTTVATFAVDSDLQITASLPPHAAGSVTVTVTTPGGSDTASFTYLPLTDLEETIEALADIQNAAKGTTGISLAYPNNPASLTTLPAVCFFVGPQTYQPYRDSEDIKIESTTIFVRLYEAPATVGVPGEIEARLKRRVPLIRDLLLAHPTIGKLNFIERAILESSTGIKAFPFAADSFLGCEWKLTVQRVIGVTYAAGE